MPGELTDQEKIRRLPWFFLHSSTNSIFSMLTFFGPVFILFLSDLGLPKTQIGFLLSLLPFAGLVALFIAPSVARAGVKRIFIICWGLRKVVAAFLLLTAASFRKVWGADFWWQYATGRFVAEHGIPREDVFSYTMTGQPWIEMRWLYCYVLYHLRELSGAGGVIVATMPLLRGRELSVIANKARIELALCDERLHWMTGNVIGVDGGEDLIG